jgi:hypothetical protein
MGAFNINITGVGGHGCERKAKPGEKLWARCGKFTCPDCMAYEFVQRMKQAGILREGDVATGQEVIHSSACNPNSEDGCRCHAIPLGAEVYESGGKTFWKKPHQALFTHWPDSPDAVVDDMLKNERHQGAF